MASPNSYANQLQRLQPNGAPDSSFTGHAKGSSLARQTDGKIISAGIEFTSPSSCSIIVERIRTDGLPDKSFSLDGRAVISVSSPNSALIDGVTTDAQGRILITASLNDSLDRSPVFVVVRLTPAGALDTSFNASGRLYLSKFAQSSLSESTGSGQRAAESMGSSVWPLPDGRLIITGGAHAMVRRYRADGMLDPAFGTNGIASIQNEQALGSNAVVLPDGKIVVCGALYTDDLHQPGASNADFFLHGYDASGVDDTTFASQGDMVTNLGPPVLDDISGAGYQIEATVVQSDGKLVTAARWQDCLILTRYTQNRQLDETFGAGGTFVLPFRPGGERVLGLATLPDQRLRVALSGPLGLTLLGMTAGGSLDFSFDSSPSKVAALAALSQKEFQAFDGSSKLVLTGRHTVAGISSLLVVRLNLDGSFDTSFNSSGVLSITGSEGWTGTAVCSRTADGSLVVAGSRSATAGQATDGLTVFVISADGSTMLQSNVLNVSPGERAVQILAHDDGTASIATTNQVYALQSGVLAPRSLTNSPLLASSLQPLLSWGKNTLLVGGLTSSAPASAKLTFYSNADVALRHLTLGASIQALPAVVQSSASQMDVLLRSATHLSFARVIDPNPDLTQLSAVPASLNFEVSARSAAMDAPVTKPLTLKNTGNQTVSGIAVSFQGESAVFTAALLPKTTLMPGEEMTVNVTMTPTPALRGGTTSQCLITSANTGVLAEVQMMARRIIGTASIGVSTVTAGDRIVLTHGTIPDPLYFDGVRRIGTDALQATPFPGFTGSMGGYTTPSPGGLLLMATDITGGRALSFTCQYNGNYEAPSDNGLDRFYLRMKVALGGRTDSLLRLDFIQTFWNGSRPGRELEPVYVVVHAYGQNSRTRDFHGVVGERYALFDSTPRPGTSFDWYQNGVYRTTTYQPVLEFDSLRQEDAGAWTMNPADGAYSQSMTLAVDYASSALDHYSLYSGNESLTLCGDTAFIPNATYRWTHNNQVTLTSTPLLSIHSSPGNAGVYTMETLVEGAVTASRQIAVHYTGTTVLTSPSPAEGEVVTLHATSAGAGATFSWSSWDAEGKSVIRGMASPKVQDLIVRRITRADAGRHFECLSESAYITMWTRVTIDKVKPWYSPVPYEVSCPATTVGTSYSYSLPAPLGMNDYERRATKFSASNLPPGIVCNASTGQLSGKPLKAGNFRVTITYSNPAGSARSTALLIVRPLPDGTSGTFTGFADRGTTENQDLGARLDLTITASARFSGALTIGSARHPLSGELTIVHGATNSSASVSVPRKGQSPLLLDFTIDHAAGSLAGALKTSAASSSVPLHGWRQTWSKARLASLREGYHTCALTHSVADNAVPCGHGFAGITVTSTGGVTISGRAGDTSVITCTAPLGPAGEILLYQSTFAGLGSIQGNLSLAANPSHALTGTATWQKNASPAFTRYFQSAFGPEPLTVEGALYEPPAKTENILSLPLVAADATNARLQFERGGLELASTNPGVSFRATPTACFFPAITTVSNPGGITSLSLNRDTGLFRSEFTLADKRTAKFYGLLVPSAAKGFGCFRLAQLPVQGQSPAQTPYFAGSVALE